MSTLKLKNRFFVMDGSVATDGKSEFATLNFAVGGAIDEFNADGMTDTGETELYVVEVKRIVKAAKPPVKVFVVK